MPLPRRQTIVSVNVKTGEVAVDDTVLAVDVGHAINPDTVEGQMHGGMAQAIGWSLMEEEFMKDGKMRNHTFHDYLIPTATGSAEAAHDHR